MAAFLYIEPGITYDIDTFIAWEPGSGGLLTLGPIYTWLLARGYTPQNEAVMIEGWAVQFLPPATKLVSEALDEARSIEVGGVLTHVFTQEHLMAVCLETGRPKDMARLIQFVQEGNPDEQNLTDILRRHNLLLKWTNFRQRFLKPL